MDARMFVMNLIAQNPNLASNPNTKPMIDAIVNNDTQTGQQIAQNICQSYGLTPEQAVQQAKQFFHFTN